jgi:hypothetical protein
MRVKLVILIIFLVSIISIFAGCVDEENTDNQENDNTDLIDEDTDIVLVNFSVVTQRWTSEKGYETIANGFVYSADATRYLVHGEVLNNGTENISTAYVYMNFYDSNDNLLHSLYDMVFNLKPGDIKSVDGDFTEYDSDYFDRADHVTFTFKQE